MKFVLIGHPVSHSLSPAIHRAAYDVLGIQGNEYVTVDCPTETEVREQVDAIRRGDLAGANVTVPWKRVALSLAEEVDASARDTGAANVLSARTVGAGRSVTAHNTDVPALARELSRGGRTVRRAVVIGSGGAALAAVVACRSLGATDVAVVARRFRGERDACGTWEGAAEFEALGARAVAWPKSASDPGLLRDAIAVTDVIVQSTSDGMSGASGGMSVAEVVPWNDVHKSSLAYDLVYNPEVTPFVSAARSAGIESVSGLGMLVGQAALAIELWLGSRPDEAPLRVAAEKALAEKRNP